MVDEWIPASAEMTILESERLSPAGGVRIDGIDLSRPLAAETKSAMKTAFLAHHVVVFPRQVLSREQQYDFAAGFGEIEHRPGAKRRNVAHVISNLDAEGHPIVRLSPAANYHWHTDKPYLAAPPQLTMLFAVEVPPEDAGPGGDTEFANMALAYEALPTAAKRRLAGLRVAFRPAFDPERPGADHPLVRTHPETGRKSLYLGNHATHILGLPDTDSRALLRELLAHATQPRFVYAHRWKKGDLVMWDNRVLLHRVMLGEALHTHRRVMHRSVVRGTVPV